MKRLAHRVCGPAILVGLLIVSLLCGCRHSSDPSLAAADSLMEEHPDSALMMLEKIEVGKMTGESNNALYYLLYTQACDKNHLILDNDSMIEYSVRYYKDHRDSYRLAKSYYFLGRVLYHQNRYSGAIVSFHKALELAENIKDYYLAGMACRGIADIYNNTYNSADEVQFAEKELEYLQQSKRQPYVNYAYYDLARALYFNRDSIRINEVMIAAEDSARLYEDQYLLSEINRLKSLSLIRDRNFKAAYPLLDSICSGPYAVEDDSLLFALTMSGLGQSDKAMEVLSESGNHNTSLYHTVKYNIHKANGEYRQALTDLEYLDSLVSLSLRTGVSHSLSSTLSEYFDIDRHAVKAELKASKTTFIVIGLLSFVMIAMLGLSIIVLIHSNRRKLEEKVRIAESLRAEVELQKKNSYKNEEDKRLLLTDNFQVLEDFGRIMMENPDSKKALKKAAEAVSRFLDELSGWGDRTKELERKVDMAFENLFSDFKADMPGLKDADYLLFLYSILNVSIPTISIILKESKIESIYNRKRRLKDKIKLLDTDKSERYLKYL